MTRQKNTVINDTHTATTTEKEKHKRKQLVSPPIFLWDDMIHPLRRKGGAVKKKRERKFARSSRNGSVILYRLMVCSQKDFSTTFSKNHHLRLSGARKKTHSIIINYIQKGGERIYSIESIEQNKKSSLFLEEYYKQKNRCLQLSILNFLFLLVFIIYFYLLLCLFD